MKCGSGNLFAMPLTPNEWLTGRIVLDMRANPVGLTETSNLHFFSDALLVELYRDTFPTPTDTVSDILLPAMFVRRHAIEAGNWSLTGYRAVDPSEIDFPEAIMAHSIYYKFVRGEIELILETDPPDRFSHMETRLRFHSTSTIPEHCLYHLGRAAEIKNKRLRNVELRNLANIDFRFSPHRQTLYDFLGLDMNEPYFNLALKQGFDSRRFFQSATQKPAPLDTSSDQNAMKKQADAERALFFDSITTKQVVRVRQPALKTYTFLTSMRRDDDFPQEVVAKGLEALILLCEAIEAQQPKTTSELYILTQATAEAFNVIDFDLRAMSKSIDTIARDEIAVDVEQILLAYGYTFDLETALAPREW